MLNTSRVQGAHSGYIKYDKVHAMLKHIEGMPANSERRSCLLLRRWLCDVIPGCIPRPSIVPGTSGRG